MAATLRRALFVSAALLTLVASGSAAADYTIQIGAFRTPSPAYVEPAKAVGTIYEEQRPNGITALSVGRFAQRAEADVALARIAKHYPDAYVRAVAGTVAGTVAETAPAPSTRSDIAGGTPSPEASGPITDAEFLRAMSPEQRARVVYLDGKLHLKQGDRFVPLRSGNALPQ